MPDQHVPLIFQLAPSLMVHVKSAVARDATIPAHDKVEILESLSFGEMVPRFPARPVYLPEIKAPESYEVLVRGKRAKLLESGSGLASVEFKSGHREVVCMKEVRRVI